MIHIIQIRIIRILHLQFIIDHLHLLWWYVHDLHLCYRLVWVHSWEVYLVDEDIDDLQYGDVQLVVVQVGVNEVLVIVDKFNIQ